jgi:hypothetical protein
VFLHSSWLYTARNQLSPHKQEESKIMNQKTRPPLTDDEGNVRELDDFKAMRPIKEVLPELVAAWVEECTRYGKPRFNVISEQTSADQCTSSSPNTNI